MQREFVKAVVATALQVELRVAHADLVTNLQERYESQLERVANLRPLTCNTIEAIFQELISEGFLKRPLLVSYLPKAKTRM
jgi:hypothetical protein